jgi:hypothetical protein
MRVAERWVLLDVLRLDVVAPEVALGPVGVEEARVAVAPRLHDGVDDGPGVGAVLGVGAEAAHLDLLHEVVVEEDPG